MQEFFIMIGLSVILAVAAFAEVPDPRAQSGLSSVPREHGANVNPGRPFVPSQGTATFVDTTTDFSAAPERDEPVPAAGATTSTNTASQVSPSRDSGAIPSDPPKMPERRPKPSGFR